MERPTRAGPPHVYLQLQHVVNAFPSLYLYSLSSTCLFPLLPYSLRVSWVRLKKNLKPRMVNPCQPLNPVVLHLPVPSRMCWKISQKMVCNLHIGLYSLSHFKH